MSCVRAKLIGKNKTKKKQQQNREREKEREFWTKIFDSLHWPGTEPGPPAWQARILPLNH